MWAIFIVFLLCSIYIDSGLCKIFQSNINKDDRKIIPMADAFGFSSSGALDISITNLKIFTTHDSEDLSARNFEHFGFFLSPAEAGVALEQEFVADSSHCILDDNDLFNFKDSGIQVVLQNTSETFVHHYDIVDEGGLFYLFFANCEDNTPVSFEAHIEMYNLDLYGGKDYLSVGERELDSLYWVMFGLFAFSTVAWAWIIVENRKNAHKIHLLMLALGLFKSLTLLAQAIQYHFIERTGYSDGWNVVFYVFTFCRGILFFTVIFLVGTGWSYMKPFLGEKERNLLMMLIPLQVFANIAIVITSEESPSAQDWFTWRDVFHLVDIICCCAILFPIVWSIKHLKEAAQTDGKAARSLEKLTLFRQFYVMVVVYIYFTRIVVYLLQSTMEYQYYWVSTAAMELATLAFYIWTASKFQPHKENPYLKVNSEEENP